MTEQLSFLEYFKRKYNIPNLEDFVSLFYISLLCAIIIYCSLKFEVLQMTLVIFVVLFFSTYLIQQYYKKKYNEEIDALNEKMKKIAELIEKVLINKEKNYS